jgi:rRNA maturation endonuclease Nob1
MSHDDEHVEKRIMVSVACPKCKNVWPSYYDFCPNCGTKIQGA